MKFDLAAIMNRWRSRATSCGCFADLFCHALTMASLSQLKRTFLPLSLLHQVMVAATIANSSCHWMERRGSRWDGSQSPRIHSLSKYAPNPFVPDASVNSWRSSASVQVGSKNIEHPFHDGRNCCHHRMSSCACLFRSR